MTVWRFLFLSVGLHILIWVFLLKNAELRSHKDESIEVTINDGKNSPQHQLDRFIPNSALPPEMLKKDKKPKVNKIREE